MKQLIHMIILFAGIIVLSSFTSGKTGSTEEKSLPENTSEIQWKTFESSIVLKNNGKKYFIFVYTDWCSWCHRMQSSTFEDEKVISLLNDRFVPVMFNAESKDPITFNGNEFKYVANGSRGYHELAAAMLNNKLSYPSVVFLDEQMNMIQPLPGYKSAEDLRIILTFLADEVYKSMGFDEYSKQQTGG